jgi:hypothetical protein
MDAQSDTETVLVNATAIEAEAVEPAELVGFGELLLDSDDFEAALHDGDFASLDLEESVRVALAEIAEAPGAGTDADGARPEAAAAAAVAEESADGSLDDDALELAMSREDLEPPVLEEQTPETLAEAPGEAHAAADSREASAAPIALAAMAQDAAAAGESLETVEFELALQNQNVVSLGFEGSIRTALEGVGGEVLFQMRLEKEDCQRVAAVRIGTGEEREFALVIMPPGGGIMRVEPVSQSTNPLARIAESYAGLMDVFGAAA